MYTALQLIKEELKDARQTFEGTVSDLKPVHLHKDPGGKALPIGAIYAHLIFSEDMTVQTLLQGKKCLSEGKWKGKTGASAPMPPPDENWSKAHAKWAKTVKVNLSPLRKYASAVYAETDKYIRSLKEKDLEKKVDLGSWGKKTVSYILYAYIIGHAYSLTGEISALKGTQGLKGYAF